jgi:hypothetical protein
MANIAAYFECVYLLQLKLSQEPYRIIKEDDSFDYPTQGATYANIENATKVYG